MVFIPIFVSTIIDYLIVISYEMFTSYIPGIQQSAFCLKML